VLSGSSIDDKGRVNNVDQDTKAVLLVGGLGTRLRSVVASTPKPLASVGDRPFLELLIRQLSTQGIRHLVLCTGYLANEIEKELGSGSRWDVAIQYSKEASPLGTGGALKAAQPLIAATSHFLVMNGDSFMEVDFGKLIEFHCKSGGIATLAVIRKRNALRYGTVQVTAGGCVTSFMEKSESSDGLVNAGIYAFSRSIFDHIPGGSVSLERDVFPKLIQYGVYAMEQKGIFVDIGTPEDYARAQVMYSELYDVACRKLPL
jgi:D-glycero-alpha-D-manno-heptose 1-phosphate guanylyltransferase